MTSSATEPSTHASRSTRTRRARTLAMVYFALSVAGLVGTWYFNVQYAGSNYVADWFTNSAASSVAVDVIVVGFVASVFYVRERDALPGRLPWALLFIPLSFLVAAAFAFPLFLGLRELFKAREMVDTAREAPPNGHR